MKCAKAHVRFRRFYMIALMTGVSLAGMVAWNRSQAEIDEPKGEDYFVTRKVMSKMNEVHMSKHPLNDEISQRSLRTFLKTLDPMKLYFLQSDIDQFNQKEFELDDMVRKGDTTLAFSIFNRFLERVDQRVKEVDALVDMDHDFTVDEDIVSDAKATTYATSSDELKDRWRKRVKYDLLLQKIENKPEVAKDGEAKKDKPETKAPVLSEAEMKAKIKRRYHSFAKRMHQINNEDLREMFLTAITTSFDPHTTYMSADTFKNFKIQMNLKLEGIGASLEFNDGNTIVKSLIPGGAAEKEGSLKAGDKVVGVGQGADGEIADTVDLNLNEVVKLIRGTPGTVVRLKVIPDTKIEPKIIAITRASIELKDSEARGEIIEETVNGQPYRIGVIDLPSFYMNMDDLRAGAIDYKSTTRDVRKILNDFTSKKVDAVILDLRRNGGGSLEEAISLTGLFIDQGPIVQIKDPSGRVHPRDDEDAGVAWSGPLVVMTSKFSASASEILAGAIQDYHRGLIVGDKATHGKGTVQSLMDLGREMFMTPNPPEFGALKITTQQFYRPNGDSTQNRGVLADVEIPSLTTHLDVGEADLDYAMKFDQVPAANYRKVSDVQPAQVAELAATSKARVEKSADFQKTLRNIERYKKQKANKKISLNEQAFMSDRAEIDSDREEEKELEELSQTNRPVVKRDFYFNEALAITLDYLRLFQVAAR
ncbi:MAG: carboxy terminal-processing peptidase [Planctomycetota bacterium]|nr:carboxy terminal-processing peptidase [Planctomycetota bacterium]